MLAFEGFKTRELMVQMGCGIFLSVLMVEVFLFANRGISFAQPRSSGKENLPLTLTLFRGVLHVFCINMVHLELWLEHRLI